MESERTEGGRKPADAGRPGDCSPVKYPTPQIPDHELLRPIGQGAYGQVWLARTALGTLRAVKVVYRSIFDSDKPFEREFTGIQRFEPISRAHEGFVDVLHAGRNDRVSRDV